jgi:hypothetical protein
MVAISEAMAGEDFEISFIHTMGLGRNTHLQEKHNACAPYLRIEQWVQRTQVSFEIKY